MRNPGIGRAAVFAALLFLATRSVWCEDNPEKLATKAAQVWVLLVDDGKYEESWDKATNNFQVAISRAEWKDALTAVRSPLGKVGSRAVKSAQFTTSLPGAPDGRYVVIQFATSFEKKKEAIETVVPMEEPDGVWRVSGYFIK